MVLATTLGILFLLETATVATSPKVPWYASIQRTKDCTDYSPITLNPDGTVDWGEDSNPVAPPFPYTREDAFKILLNTCEFKRADGPDRVPSLQVELLNVLWHQPDRLLVFANLYERGNMPGKLHALVGLYVIDQKQYARRLKELAQEGRVVAQNGCVIIAVPVREIVREIENGTIAAEFQKVGTYMTWLPKIND